MKRLREITNNNNNNNDINNHFFDLIIKEPLILHHIFNFIILNNKFNLKHLLNIYRILFKYFKEDINIMKSLESFLYEFGDEFKEYNLYFFKQEKYNLNKCNYNLEEYINRLKKYQIFRWTKNFVIYGLCGNCNCIKDIENITKIKGYNKKELQSKYIHYCKKCKKELFPKSIWLNKKEVISEIGKNILCDFLVKHFEIRYFWDNVLNEYQYCLFDVYKCITELIQKTYK